MTILALDQSSQVSGYSVFKDNQLFASGTFSFSGNLEKRLVKIRNKVEELINVYNPNKIILEDIQLEQKRNDNVHTYKVLAEVIGVIQELIEEKKIKQEIVVAGTWRSALGIKGKEREVYKKNAQTYVLNTYNKQVSEDEADAICIGAYGIKDLDEGFSWGK